MKNETRFWWNWVILGGNSFFLNEIALFLGDWRKKLGNCRSGRLSSSWNEHKRHYSNGKGCFKSLIWPNLVNSTHSTFFFIRIVWFHQEKVEFLFKILLFFTNYCLKWRSWAWAIWKNGFKPPFSPSPTFF